jgi:hypothetical protein
MIYFRAAGGVHAFSSQRVGIPAKPAPELFLGGGWRKAFSALVDVLSYRVARACLRGVPFFIDVFGEPKRNWFF